MYWLELFRCLGFCHQPTFLLRFLIEFIFVANYVGLDEHGRIIQWKDNGGATTDHHDNGGNSNADDTILTRMKDRNLRDLNYLINKPPRWNEQVGAYVLNFNGRVTMASVKNFQLVDPDEQNAVVLQVRPILLFYFFSFSKPTLHRDSALLNSSCYF